ncbi:MAG: hypothetical protein KQJ78_16910 [Deltaproteobacteria bacterium]|nr:hypothetical protein [Deltaproteobacteria bacterium]
MKVTKLVTTLALALALVAPLTVGTVKPAHAMDLTPTAEFDLTFASKYVWRGIVVVDDWVAQPSVTAGVAGFSVNVWGDFMLTDENDRKNEFDEIDITLDYTYDLADFGLSAGLVNYSFPNGVASTTELYAAVAYNWIVTPSLKLYWDVQEAHGLYLIGSLDWGMDLFKPNDLLTFGVAASASMAYSNSDHNVFYYGVDEAGFADALLSLSLPVGIGDHFSITPGVYWSMLVDEDIRNSMDPVQDDNNVYFGISFTASF